MSSNSSVPLKIMILTQWFDPEPTFKGLTFAKALKERGHDISVVTGFPNYPGGKLYEGYSLGFKQLEILDGIEVKRLYLYPSHSNSALGRIFNYVSFFFSVLFYLLFLSPRVDVIYVYHPPITVGLAATIARFFKRTPVLLDIQDIWPDTLAATGMIKNRHVLSLIGRACSAVYSNVDHIVVLSKGFRKLLNERGVVNEKLTVIPNWADIRSVSADTRLPEEFSNYVGFKLLFAGNMGMAQNLDTIVDAAIALSRFDAEIKVFLLGDGVAAGKLKSRVSQLELQNVVFLPRVPMTEVGFYLDAADCLLVHLKSDPLFEITIPSKTQAYLAAGKPIIMAVNGDAADMVHESGAGICVQPEDPNALADAILKMAKLSKVQLTKMGKAGKVYYKSRLNLDVGTTAFERLFYTLAHQRFGLKQPS